jgi:hypothetical protein
LSVKRVDPSGVVQVDAEHPAVVRRWWGRLSVRGRHVDLVVLTGREAVEVLAGSQARLEHAHALVDLGAALRRANQRTEAREQLREGVDLARRVGAFGLAARANEEIAASGARPRKVLQAGLDALTASERRVAQLAADGMSNKSLAAPPSGCGGTLELRAVPLRGPRRRRRHRPLRSRLGVDNHSWLATFRGIADQLAHRP